MKSVLFILASALFFSCNNNSESSNAVAAKDTTAIDTTSTATSNVATTECYAQIDKDTVLLRISSINGSVNGTLYIHHDGKDVNQGNIAGDMRGDTLIAEYTFYSEGVQSNRQVAFLKKDSTIIEGFGDVEEKEGKMIFKNTAALKFEDKMKLSKVPCTQ